MSSRYRARRVALQYLYQNDLQEIFGRRGQPVEGSNLAPSATGMIDVDRFFDHFEVPGRFRQFARQLIIAATEHKPVIDLAIQKLSRQWQMNRLGFIDRNILRLGIAEIFYLEDVPAAVSIDEAIRLAKEFGSAETSSFINGMLDACQKLEHAELEPAQSAEASSIPTKESASIDADLKSPRDFVN